MRRNTNNRNKRNRRQPNRQVAIKSLTKTTNFELGRTEREVRKMYRPVLLPRLMFAPESVLVDLVYPDVAYNRNNVTATFISWRYRANSIYDPDPALGSGSVPGYTFWSGAYQAYLVIGIGYDIQITNMEASPVDLVVVPTNNDIGLNYSGIGEMFGNPHASVNQVSAKGGMDKAHFKGYIDLGRQYGNMIQYIADFGSSFGGNPTAVYLNVGGTSATAFTANNGLDIRVNLTYRTLLFSRKSVIL